MKFNGSVGLVEMREKKQLKRTLEEEVGVWWASCHKGRVTPKVANYMEPADGVRKMGFGRKQALVDKKKNRWVLSGS